MNKGRIVPPEWNPKTAGDAVLQRLITVTAPQVKGAHDAEMVLVGDHAYIVAEVNDMRPDHGLWNDIYSALSVVCLKTLSLEAVIPFAASKQVFENEILPEGQCFVPRIIQKDNGTLRCYFASQNPGQRQEQVWHIDFNLESRTFENCIFKTKLKTAAGIFDMQPQYFHDDAVALGFTKSAKDHGMYLFDSFKVFDGRTYVAINNFPGKQNALAVANDTLDTFEILGHYNEPQSFDLSESAVNRLPDGTWMAICRHDGGNRNYVFTTSRDGRVWSPASPRDFVPNGTSSKPTFDRFGGLYYLGWQEVTKINGIGRSVFNLDVSRDGAHWERKYHFETDCSFQYPTFREHDGAVYLTVSQGPACIGGQTHINFGKLEDL